MRTSFIALAIIVFGCSDPAPQTVAVESRCTKIDACADEPCLEGECAEACGDAVVGGLEGCDDGNTDTEACQYGETACTVCAGD